MDLIQERTGGIVIFMFGRLGVSFGGRRGVVGKKWVIFDIIYQFSVNFFSE